MNEAGLANFFIIAIHLPNISKLEIGKLICFKFQ